MKLSSRLVSFFLGICIALVTTLFLSLFDDVKPLTLAVNFILCFAASYLLIQITLDILVFREINSIYKALERIKKRDLNMFKKQEGRKPLNPLRQINKEIFSYAHKKQQQINELKEIETFRKEFLADVSHELKTPIFAAQGYLHTLLDGAVDDEEIRHRFLKKAAKSLDGLDALVQDILVLSKMESGSITMEFKEVDLYHLVSEVFEQFEYKAEKRNIKLKMPEIPPSPMFVYADPYRIRQVIVNLVSNAIKYSADGSEVNVELKKEKNDIWFAISDQGLGIPPEDLNRIFERFYRVEKSRSKDRGGTGLGLAIASQVVRQHGSKIAVTSAIGKGSTFSFYLPKMKKKAEIKDKASGRK
ncbi:MAG: ATP-binding protein [Cyclobacteriaceae bacterium]|nr:ATP-binding protein [Cyclobacteriaceae bacterium]MCH8514934.1 ATP-binding protein [Cyclobacteriaceae bacterium]